MVKTELKLVSKRRTQEGKCGIFDYAKLEDFEVDFEDLAEDTHKQGFEIDAYFSVGKVQYVMKGVHGEQGKLVDIMESLEHVMTDIWEQVKVTTFTVEELMNKIRVLEYSSMGFAGEPSQQKRMWEGYVGWRQEDKTIAEVLSGTEKVKKLGIERR